MIFFAYKRVKEYRQYKDFMASKPKVLIEIRKPKNISYVEKVFNIVFSCIILAFLILLIYSDLEIGLDNKFIIWFMPAAFYDFLYIQSSLRKGSLITTTGITNGYKYVKWNEISEYRWIKQDENNSTLLLNKKLRLYPITDSLEKKIEVIIKENIYNVLDFT